MQYKELCNVYEKLEATKKGLEKTKILSEFLHNAKKELELIYLLQGRIFPDYDTREIGISEQTVIKAIAKTSGVDEKEVVKKFKEKGDLGKAACEILKSKKQSSLFSKNLTTEKVLSNLRKLPEMEGKGTVDNKIGLIVELLHSATPNEAKYVIRTLLGDLKVGTGNGLIRDSIIDFCFHPKDIAEKKEKSELVQSAYDKSTDFAEVFEKACSNKLHDISLSPGKPVKVMLFPKAHDIADAFEIVGKPAAFEFKYDGFRMLINKDEKGVIKIFTRRLENVSNQFQDAEKYARENISANSFIIDCEAVGFNPKTKKYMPFQDISQRIKRKYDIEQLEKELPIELNVFDILYYNGKTLINTPFKDRRKIIEKIIKEVPFKIRLAEQIITDNEKEAQKFYDKALKEGQEGLMGKSLEGIYKPGARVGFGVKIKPEAEEFDLVITGAEWGTGKRAGWLTSFDVSCIDKRTSQLLEIGKVSTGLKEKPEEGFSFEELTNILKKLKLKEDAEGKHMIVKPEIVITVGYQDIQRSPTYTSGFALRFPRFKALRPDRSVSDIASVEEVRKEAGKKK